MTVIAASTDYTFWPGMPFSDVRFETGAAWHRDHVDYAYTYIRATPLEKTIDAISEGWVGIVLATPRDVDNADTGEFLRFQDNSGNTFFAFARGDGGDNDEHATFTSPFVAGRTTLLPFASGPKEVAVAFKIDPVSGYLKVYADQSLIVDFSGDTQSTFGASIEKLVLTETGPENAGVWTDENILMSEFVISTEPTLGFKVYPLDLSQGAVNDWIGTVDNVTGRDLAESGDEIGAAGVDQLLTLTFPNLPILTGPQYVGGVTMQASIRAGGSSTADEFDLLIYEGTNEYGAERLPLPTGYDTLEHTWSLDPRTVLPWTETGVNEISLGIATRSSI